MSEYLIPSSLRVVINKNRSFLLPFFLSNNINDSLDNFFSRILSFSAKPTLSESNLSGCELQNATLYGAKLKDTNLSNSNLSEVTLDSAVLDGTDLSNTNLEDSFAYNTQFENVKIRGADFTNVFLPKDVARKFCEKATGTNPFTNRETRETLECDYI